MIHLYGVVNNKGDYFDVSKTLQGAKNYATRNKYKFVAERHGYNAVVIAKKEGKKWINF